MWGGAGIQCWKNPKPAPRPAPHGLAKIQTGPQISMWKLVEAGRGGFAHPQLNRLGTTPCEVEVTNSNPFSPLLSGHVKKKN
jgi:hypothetical protein